MNALPTHDRAKGDAAVLDGEGFQRMRSRALEVRILAVGGLLLGIVVAELILVWLTDAGMGRALARGVLLEAFAGREAGIPVALGGGAPAWLVAQLSATQDIGVVCLAYPAFLWALERYGHRDNWLMRRLRRTQERALAHRAFARRWGPLGVFAFMLVPFLINGPLIGAVAGRVAGIRTKQLVLPVVAATCVAAVAWSFAYEATFAAVGGLDPRLPPLFTIVIVALVLGWAALGEWRESRRTKAGQS